MADSLTDILDWRSLRWHDDCTYEGLTADGACESHGVVMWAGRRERYEGQLRGSRPHGYGAYRWRDGMLYRGEWYDGQMQGCGVLIWKDEQGTIQAKAGKFFDDGYVGPVPGCSEQAAHEAALEADVAAGRARQFETRLLRSAAPAPRTEAMVRTVPAAQPATSGHHPAAGDGQSPSRGLHWWPWGRQSGGGSGNRGGGGGAHSRTQGWESGHQLGRPLDEHVANGGGSGWAGPLGRSDRCPGAASAGTGAARWGSLQRLQQGGATSTTGRFAGAKIDIGPGGWVCGSGSRDGAVQVGELMARTRGGGAAAELSDEVAPTAGGRGGDTAGGPGPQLTLDQRRRLERLLAADVLSGMSHRGRGEGALARGTSGMS